MPGNTAGTITLDSIGGVQSKGLEVDANWLVAPTLILNGSFAYTEATIRSFETDSRSTSVGSWTPSRRIERTTRRSTRRST